MTRLVAGEPATRDRRGGVDMVGQTAAVPQGDVVAERAVDHLGAAAVPVVHAAAARSSALERRPTAAPWRPALPGATSSMTQIPVRIHEPKIRTVVRRIGGL